MLGDVNYRLPSIVDAMTYTNAGVKTYLYYQGILNVCSADSQQIILYTLEFQILVKTSLNIFRLPNMAHLMERNLFRILALFEMQNMGPQHPGNLILLESLDLNLVLWRTMIPLFQRKFVAESFGKK